MEQHERDERLMDYICGNLSAEDKSEIETWIGEQDDHRCYYEALFIAYYRQRWFFRKELLKKDKPSLAALISRKKRKMYVWPVAASILLLLGIFVVQTFRDIPEERTNFLLAEKMILPGAPKARLYLSGGKPVLLDETPVLIRTEEGVRVRGEQPGEIFYEHVADISGEEMLHTLVVERGGEYRVVLSDSTVVWLNSASSLEYPVNFTGQERRVRLKGEAYFRVRTNPAIPFVVEVEGIRVKATGTAFNINTHRYNRVETVLVEGVVHVEHPAFNYRLHPSQKAVYDVHKGEITLETVEVEPYIAWTQGDFVFQNERLEEILDKLALWYDCEVFYEHQELKEIRLSGDMKRYDRIENLLYFFEGSAELKFRVEGKTIIVGSK